MAAPKRLLAAVVIAFALATATLGFAASSSAAPYVTAPTISVSTTAPCKSTPINVVGSGFVPGSTVTLTLAGVATLGSVTVGANGQFTTTVILPEVTGIHQLVASGPATSTNSNTAQATLNLMSCVSVPVTG
jgi:hypothetical protein